MTYPVVVFEGVDGAGKSFALEALKKYFETHNVPVRIANSIPYNVFMEAHNSLWYDMKNPNVRYIQFLAYEVNNFYRTIQPYINKSVVLVDRFIPSCFAYNSLEPLNIEYNHTMNKMMDVLCKDFYRPEVVFWFDVPNEVLVERFRKSRQHEAPLNLVFVEQVRRQYKLFQERYGHLWNIIQVDGNRSLDDTVQEMLYHINTLSSITGVKL
jgi:thymidylate kinase